ncbi:MAG: bifunctional adenosylcobinamide kinase/adenosylcobinamide-phosphate guanylyltransferase [Dehalococcoidia bacterium]|nr:bifunctional adenosylcobinamide kinase/adenosylcobinamide-phosphate guanylyltransferase [Dehalococcoidia bacterium]
MPYHKKIILILGGARSGKSSYAQQAAAEKGGSVLFCATARPLDEEMRQRIEAHRLSRPAGWDTLEVADNLASALADKAESYETILIDCITLLTANCMGNITSGKQAEECVDAEIEGLIGLMQRSRCSFILVSNEVGSGIVPDNALARVYRDALGRANQRLAAAADEVILMTAGLPLKLK